MLANDEIRVFELYPAGEEDCPDAPLRGEVHVVSLSSSPDYEALSYVWGHPDDTTSIEVAGRKVVISRNLESFMRKLRHPSQTRRLWADQICIDQSDSAEKTTQVQMMREIYSNCRQCLISLGEIPKSVRISAAEDMLRLLMFASDSNNFPMPPFCLSSEEVKKVMKVLLLIHPFGNQWWQRIWTVQEVVLPQKKTCFWGSLVLPWELIHKAVYQFGWSYEDNVFDSEDYRTWNALSANVIWISYGRNSDGPVITATKWRYRRATNPRDKVFGLLGLIPDDVDMAFTNRCNYESTEAAVFAAFTLDSIVASEGLQPLHFNPRLEDETATKGVPGWALDLKANSRYEADPFFRNWASEHHYRACGGRPFDMSHLRDTVEANGGSTHALGVSGLRFGKVVEVSRERCAVPYYDVGYSDVERLLSDNLRSWHALAAVHSRRYADPRELRERFCRLVIGDLLAAPEEDERDTRIPEDEDVDNVWRFVTGEEEDASEVWSSEQHISSQLCNQAFFLTESGVMGMGPWDTQVGDEVWVLDGGNYPFALRPRGQGEDVEDFDFLDCCYVDGIMFGEIFQAQDEANIRKIRLH